MTGSAGADIFQITATLAHATSALHAFKLSKQCSQAAWFLQSARAITAQTVRLA